MKTALRVLIVEDSREDAELLLHALRQEGYQPSHALVSTAQGFRTELGRQVWDLVISDYVIPGFGGPAALQILKESGLDTPFIIVSGKIGEDVAVEALHAGANDYLLKDRLTRLGPAIDRALKEAVHKRKRRQAEQALRESEERYRRLVEACPDAMFITTENEVVFANPAAVSLLGAKSPVEIINKPFVHFVESSYRDLVREHLSQALQGMDGPLLELKLVRMHGGHVLAESLARVIQYHGASVVQVLCRDISSRKQLEQELLNSRKMEAIGRLAGGVANDFNNLLTVITGYTGLIRSGLAPDHPLQRDLQHVMQSTERAIALTNQLLAISRKEVLAPETVNLNMLVDQIMPLVRRLMGDSVEVEHDLQGDLRAVRADRGQIETVIINLAMHARESMTHGGKLTLRTSNLTLAKAHREQVHIRAGSYVVLSLTDTGLGLSEEFREHLFEPFFGNTQPGKNTGLGLATVYAIVRQHGAQIQCTSEVGKGSTYSIYFPAAETTQPAMREDVAPPRPHKRSVILLVEDEEVLREFGNLILRKHGYHVLSARDGVEALHVAEQFQNPLDLLFTDVVMPRMGGAELSRRFSERYPKTPILFTSGYPRSILVESGLDDRGLEFLQKPYTTQSLLTKIREVLSTAANPA